MSIKNVSFNSKNIRIILILLSLFIGSLVLRVYGIFDNHPFWVDEFSSANQAKLIIEHGIDYFTNPQLNVEYNNVINHFLIAISFIFFGQHEWAARIPFVIIGSLVPIMVFILSRRLFNIQTAIGASLLTTFSYFQITWSRQARGYVLLELLILITVYLYTIIIGEKKVQKKIYVLFFLSVILGVLTHFAYYLLLTTLFIHFIFTQHNNITTYIKNKYYVLSAIFFAFIVYKIGIISVLLHFLSSGIIKANNVWYYHAFLWREYGLITFLTLVGLIGASLKHNKYISLFILYVSFNLFFFCFMFAPYVSRYLLSIFPLLFIFSAYALSIVADALFTSLNSSRMIQKYGPLVLTLGFIGFIIVNGYKFNIKPIRFYSVNHDFREIAIIDYNQVYRIIKNKGKLEEGRTAVIDTWHDRTYWYLGTDFQSPYLFRWADEKGKLNGLEMRTEYIKNNKGEKIIPRQKHLRFISNLSDFKRVMIQYPRGFIFIDDSTLPNDVLRYVTSYLKKELYLDHYPLDDNPYSIWPATLYSWGIEK